MFPLYDKDTLNNIKHKKKRWSKKIVGTKWGGQIIVTNKLFE